MVCISFLVKVKYKKILPKLFKELKKQKIMFRVICSGNILNHPVKKYLNYSVFQKLNNSNRVHNDGFFIGNHPINITKELYKVRKIFDNLS